MVFNMSLNENRSFFTARTPSSSFEDHLFKVSSVAHVKELQETELRHYLCDAIQSPNVATVCADIHKPHQKDQKGLKFCK